MFCPYCGREAVWCENKIIYGKNYGHSWMMYLCEPCDAYVGCHNNTRRPLGIMANKELREWRKKAHKAIDPVWREYGAQRKEVYAALNRMFGREVHVGESTIEECKEIIKRSSELYACFDLV